YGFPMVMNYAVFFEYFVDKASLEYKAPPNQLYNTARVYTPKDTAIVTPNSDTPYSFVAMDLRAEPRHRPDLLGDEPGQAHGDRPVFTSDEALTLSRSPAASRSGAPRGPWLCTGRATPAASVPHDRPLLVTRREEEYERGTCVFSAARCHPSTCCRPEGDVVDDQTSL